MEKKEKIYEGKAKIVYACSDSDKVIIHFKDEVTAGDGVKRDVIQGKGEINCTFSSLIFRLLEKEGIPTHFIDQLSPRDMLCWKVKILPIEVIIRNYVAGSLAKRLGMEEGAPLSRTILEHDYKSDELHDPMVNLWHILAFGWASEEDYNQMNQMALQVNELLKKFFDERGIILVDFKLEFGKKDGKLLLADEITPDGCRLWDKATKKKLDKDRFRRDLGGVKEAYEEVLGRIKS